MPEHDELTELECLVFRVHADGQFTIRWAEDHTPDEAIEWLKQAIETIQEKKREKETAQGVDGG